MDSGICHEIDAFGNIDHHGRGLGGRGIAQAQLTPPSTAGAKPKPVTTVPIRPALQSRPTPPTRWRRPSGWRCSRIWPGSASIMARSRATSASAWSTPSRNSRRPAAASRPACSIRRSAARSPTPRSGGRKASAGRSSPIPAPACGSASRPRLVPQQSSDANGTKWTSPTGTIQIQLARRKEANPTTAKLAEREKKEPPGAPSTTRSSSRISSCCPACRA